MLTPLVRYSICYTKKINFENFSIYLVFWIKILGLTPDFFMKNNLWASSAVSCVYSGEADDEDNTDFEDFLNHLSTIVPPEGMGVLDQEMVIRHAEFLVNQVRRALT